MATVREGVMKKEIFNPSHQGEVKNIDVDRYVNADVDFVVKVIERHIEKSRFFHSGSVLNLAGDTTGDVQFWAYGGSGLSDLPFMFAKSGIYGCTEDALDNYDKVLEIVGEICGDVVAVNAESVDNEGPHVVDGHVNYAAGTQQNIDVINQAGLNGISLPREYNGLNFPIVPFIMAAELVARADAGLQNIWGRPANPNRHPVPSGPWHRFLLPILWAGIWLSVPHWQIR